MVLFAPIAPPQSGVKYTANNVELKVGAAVIGKGTLYITVDALAWQPEASQQGISIDWRDIGLHGVNSIPSKHIFFQLNKDFKWPGLEENCNGHSPDNEPNDANGTDDDEDNDCDEGNISDNEYVDYSDEECTTEFWLTPADAHATEIMFQAMSECQALHPDYADSISDESDYMDGIEEQEDDLDDAVVIGADVHAAQADAQNGIQNLNISDNDDRFEDADE